LAAIEPYAAPGVWDPPFYTQAVKVTGARTTLYISGQVAYDDEGKPAHPGDFKSQTRAVLLALKAQVEAGGGTMAGLVKIVTYVTDARYIPDYRTVREEFFGKKGPVGTLVIVAGLYSPLCLIEIEAVAEL
jgi:enamine deaminase RidA (YjgF/YER057c/UK114 family)